MEFQVKGQAYDTREMECLDLDGLYLTIYASPERGLVFVQTFDEEKGVLIAQATPEQSYAVLELLQHSRLPDFRFRQEWVRSMISPRSYRTARDGWGKAAVA